MSKIANAIARHSLARAQESTFRIADCIRLAMRSVTSDEDDDVTRRHLLEALTAIGERRGWRNAAYDVTQSEIDYGTAPGKAKR